jgi:hypothetical protein
MLSIEPSAGLTADEVVGLPPYRGRPRVRCRRDHRPEGIGGAACPV